MKDPKNFAAVKTIPFAQLGGPAIGENFSEVDLLTQTGYLTFKSVDGNIAIVDYSTEEVRHAMAGMYLHQLVGKTIEQAGVMDFAIRLVKDNPETLVRIFNRLLESVDYEAYSIEDAKSVLAVIQIAMINVRLSPVIKVIAKGESVLEVQAGERTIVLTLEYCHPDQEAEQLLQVAVSQLDKPFSGKLGGRMEILKLVLVFSESDRRITVWSVA